MNKSTSLLSRSTITRIGIDIAKRVFHLHGVDASGEVVLQQAVRRPKLLALMAELPSCLVGLEACSSSHYWARELGALGHHVKLLPPSYVKAYVRRQKNDMADAAAICEAVGRPSMRFVPVKSPAQQGALMLHRVRTQFVGQRTALINALRGHLSEFGIIAPQGGRHIAELIAVIEDTDDDRLPAAARAALTPLIGQIQQLDTEVKALDKQILVWHRNHEASLRLATIPGIGPLTASAIVASVGDISQFRSGREFAAFLGLVPRQSSSGGKERLGRITKMGDRYIRKLLVVGATAVLRYARNNNTPLSDWAVELLKRKPYKVVAVALANKLARIAWALLSRQERYRTAKAATPVAA